MKKHLLCTTILAIFTISNLGAQLLEKSNVGVMPFTHTDKRYVKNSKELQSIVVESGEEGDGFYKLCEELGITSDWQRLKRDETFAMTEINKCHDFWRDNNNYQSFK